VFLLVGIVACGIAAMRRRSGGGVLAWLGIWSAVYGARPLTDALALLGLLPRWFQAILPFLDTVISYLILVVANRTFLELTTGWMRNFTKAVIAVALAIAVAGIGWFVWTGVNDKFIPYHNVLATCGLSVLMPVIAVPKLSRKFLLLPERGVLLAGTLVFAGEALYANLARPFGYRPSTVWDSLGFVVFLFSFGYVALQMIFAGERKLLSIERELTIAREIQTSILPNSNPEMKSLEITAAYRPMAEVAGDFYEFVRVDENRIGVLVADVSGHGVPAALIASMIKVAMQTVVGCAQAGAVMRGLNRILSGQPEDQFVTAAYFVH
jgi:phosphoserine phosphatase RsbU/P